MPDRTVPVQEEQSRQIREAVGVNTSKIFDTCLDKDCVDELRVYPTVSSQTFIENALNIRPRSADLLYVDVSVAPISFNRGYYTVDCTYFYRVTGETFPAGQTVTGLAVFDKRVMLFGSEGSSKRAEIKKLLCQLRETNPAVDMNIFRSVENVNLQTLISYHLGNDYHHFLDDFDKGLSIKGTNNFS